MTQPSCYVRAIYMAKDRLTLSDSVVNEVFTIIVFILYKLIGGEASSFDLSQELVCQA